MIQSHFCCIIDQSKYNARSDSRRGEISSALEARKGRVTLQRRMLAGTGGFFVHNLISVLWSLCFIFFLHQNTLIPSQDIRSLIQLCDQAPPPVSCDLHLVQIQRRALGCNFCQSPGLETKKRSYSPHSSNMQWWDREGPLQWMLLSEEGKNGKDMAVVFWSHSEVQPGTHGPLL